MFGLFRKNIIPNEDVLEKNLVTLFTHTRGKVKVNAILEVPQGFQAVVVRNGKVLDLVGAGRHRINGSIMPSAFKKLKIGKPSKKGNYRTRFKAQVYFVNLRTFAKFAYVSGNTFHTRSEQFGRVKGYTEGVCELRVEDAEELMKYLLRYLNKLSPKLVNKQIGELVGNEVNKALEKSKLAFAKVLLNPEELKQYFNPAVATNVSEYGILAENVQLNSLQLNKRMQKRVSEFLQNRSQFDDAMFGPVSVQPEPEQAVEQEMVQQQVQTPQPQQQVAERASQPQSVAQTQAPQPQAQQSANPLLSRRLSSANLMDANTGNAGGVVIPSLNTGELLTNSDNNLKQCKYCGATIEMHHKYCPKCGFKQY